MRTQGCATQEIRDEVKDLVDNEVNILKKTKREIRLTSKKYSSNKKWNIRRTWKRK